MQRGLSVILILVGGMILFALAGGAFFLGRQTSIVQKVTLPTQHAPTETVNKPSPPVADETANWKTFRSDKAGIEFKYPTHWLVKESHFINVYPSSYNNSELAVISFSETNNPKKLSLQDFQKEIDKDDKVGLSPLYYSASDKPFEIGGVLGYQHTPCGADGSQPLSCKMYVVPYGDKIFLLRTFNWPDIENQEKVFDQMLSTFKFNQS